MTDLHNSKLQGAYLPVEKFRHDSARWTNNALGALLFSKEPFVSSDLNAVATDLPFAQVPMAALDVRSELGSICEVWAADGSFTYGASNGLRYGHNEKILFGAIQLSEADFDTGNVADGGKTPLQRAAESAYAAIFNLTDRLKYPDILRFWNYIADINGHSHGMERYRQFNMGRHDGFLASGHKVTGSVPAACALGFAEGPLTIYFLAGRGVSPIAIENPRQVSAYKYPDDYGPRSPTFSRASVVPLGDVDILFLSGTASIVGHRTLHAGDVIAQTRETIANITAIVTEANRMAPRARFALDDLCCKVYVRNRADVAVIHDELRRLLGASARLMFLEADICRQDLLMEIEATAGHPLEFSIDGAETLANVML